MVSGSGSDVAHRCTDSIRSHNIRYPHTGDKYRVGVYQMSCSGADVGRSRLPVTGYRNPVFPGRTGRICGSRTAIRVLGYSYCHPPIISNSGAAM